MQIFLAFGVTIVIGILLIPLWMELYKKSEKKRAHRSEPLIVSCHDGMGNLWFECRKRHLYLDRGGNWSISQKIDKRQRFTSKNTIITLLKEENDNKLKTERHIINESIIIDDV